MDWHKKPVVLTADVDLEKGLRRDSVESLEDDDTDEAHIMKATPEVPSPSPCIDPSANSVVVQFFNPDHTSQVATANYPPNG